MDALRVIKRSPLIFPMACVAVLALVLVSEVSYWQSSSMIEELDLTAVVPVSIQQLQMGITDAETAQRDGAEVDTADQRQAQVLAYGLAVQSIANAFRALDLYYDQQPKPEKLLTSLHQLVEDKLAGRGAVGPQQMAAISRLCAELLQHEASKVADGRLRLHDTRMLGRMGVATLSAIALLTLFVLRHQMSALGSQRREQQRLMQAAHDILALEVNQRTSELTALTRHLQTAREEERAHLARDLHDELGALLTSAKLDGARIRSRLTALPTPAPEALERLAHLTETLNDIVALKRRIIEDLHPSALSMLGLVASLEIMAREFTEGSGIKVLCRLEPVQLSASANLTVYRLMQEAITNVSKYAQADHVWLALCSRDGQVEVSVRDDGTGFDPNAPTRSAHGLMGMRFRVEAEGGSLSIIAAPGHGALITAKLPEQPPMRAPERRAASDLAPVGRSS